MAGTLDGLSYSAYVFFRAMSMTNAQWFMLVGGLLLAMGLTYSVLKRSLVTSAIIYLAVGILVGPTVLNLFHFNPLKQSALLEVLTEIAVLISLFSAGVKMPVPFNLTRWRAPILLATVSMTLTVALVAAFAYYVLGLPLGAGFCWARSWHRRIRCWPRRCKFVIPETVTSCALP